MKIRRSATFAAKEPTLPRLSSTICKCVTYCTVARGFSQDLKVELSDFPASVATSMPSGTGGLQARITIYPGLDLLLKDARPAAQDCTWRYIWSTSFRCRSVHADSTLLQTGEYFVRMVGRIFHLTAVTYTPSPVSYCTIQVLLIAAADCLLKVGKF